MVNKTDQELVDEARRGNRRAFGDLITRHQDRLYRTLRSVLGSAEDAQDACQETFLTAFQKLHLFGGRSAFYSWLFRIGFNAAINCRRRRRSVASLDALRDQSVEVSDRAHPSSPPEGPLEVRETQAAVRQALGELPEEFRTALVLKELEGLKYEEIAELQNCPIGTVRSRIFRAREDLRQRLAVRLQAESVR
jgi:RNA polymerase sigma-70 factor (ECF subfamily)